ncbi:glycosyltransferase [Chitinophaga sp. MM2321]|uniref:glycosyltransferase n=1 Tax=Chitinophaga sp. MM2321 TaxID=3137178 RepID=UPI0032D588C4
MEKILFFFTESFPYGKGESFIENEIEFLCGNFQKVIIVPSQQSETTNNIRTIPQNAVVFPLGFVPKYKLLLLLPRNLFIISRAFFFDFFSEEKKNFKKIKLFRKGLHAILWGLYMNSKLDQAFKSISGKYYSYWMNNGALALTLRRMKNPDIEFVFRTHRYDLYQERSKYGLIPFQQLNCYFAKYILPVSQNGQNYLRNIKPQFSSKIISSYLGVPDRGINIIPEECKTNNFVIVSCSFMVPVKRIDLIIASLMLLEIDVTWIHLGGGPEMGKIKKLCQYLPTNISYKLLGDMSNWEIMNFYKENAVNLFIHLSASEGIPVAIMEAVSFGIPVLATDVGGVAELVSTETGILVNEDASPEKVASSLKIFLLSDRNTQAFRKRVRQFWENNFNAEKNYNNFISSYLLDQ